MRSFLLIFFNLVLIFIGLYLGTDHFASADDLNKGLYHSYENKEKSSASDFVSKYDSDGDEKVSKEEFQGSSDVFKILDKNGDGYISSDEIEKKHPAGPKGGFSKEAHFKRMDIDGDGKISRDEFKGPDEHFSMFDKNNDGYLEIDELPDAPPRRGGQGMGRPMPGIME